MEYLIVELWCPEGRERSRRVKIDGEFAGQSDEHYFELERGTHFVSLGPPNNFTPDEEKIRLRNTTPDDPMVVSFHVA